MTSFTPATDNKALHDLRDGVTELNRNIKELNTSTKRANVMMIILTFAILIFTAVLVFQGL